MIRPIRTLLIANRGEIAVRIIRTARRMGLRTVAVFSDADAGALHVAMADEAVRLGPAPARESYLNIPAVLAAAAASAADAVHPGYGFLAENPEFAEACAQAGLIFIGPPAAAIRAMGDKGRARAMMAQAGVPMVPGTQGEDQSLPVLEEAAAAIGYPVLIKAVAGGGGKGMRVVDAPAGFSEALQSAKREAVSAFGDDRVIVERYLRQPRHIEVQVFADQAGETVHLFERDCSIQRRHQKVIEEAPAPGLSEDLRQGLRRAAITCARAVDYVGAGTVEFLVADDHFFFMEMNTRLQVEHPVTEAISGLDLVEWQIRVARGEPLPLGQDAIASIGHAIEARLCAESPVDDFLPRTGRLVHLHFPVSGDGIRIDSGVRAGDEITVHYDSLIAKIIAHGGDRAEAVARLHRALAGTELVGVANNRQFLSDIVGHSAFAADDIDTGFIERHRSDLLGGEKQAEGRVLALAAFAALRSAERSAAGIVDPADPFSPWQQTGGWRLGCRASLRLELVQGETVHAIEATWRPGGYDLRWGTEQWSVEGSLDPDGTIAARIGESRMHARSVIVGHAMTLFADGRGHEFKIIDPTHPGDALDASVGHLASPMPGLVVAVTAKVGAAVEKGAPLVVVEAMKMEHAVTAPRAGRVQAVHVAVGDQVSAGTELVALEVIP